MRYFFILFCQCLMAFIASAQEVRNRIIFIGDAGEINDKQQHIIEKANELVLLQKTHVFFIGDNIYPKGMGLDSASSIAGRKSLDAQFSGFKSKGLPVYFLAGNHDWNVSKPGGLEKLKAQESYIASQGDSLLKFIPQAGTPGPYTIHLSPKLVAIVYDSEYWLYPYHEGDEVSEEKRSLFLSKLQSILTTEKDKQVLLISHHPMESFGEHGLSFGLKQHIFPLTRIKNYLYIPLPIMGTLYPLWRKNVSISAEDLPHPVYQRLITDIRNLADKHSNVLYVSGHDHGLQYIAHDNFKQIVSGSGSKTSYIRSHSNLKYKFEQQGFCVVDELTTSQLHITFYKTEGNTIIKSFETFINKI